MKHLIVIVFLFIATQVVCQKALMDEPAPPDIVTTIDEYNYLTKGLKRTLEEGADAKSGYTLIESQPFQHRSGKYEFTFRPFVKNETGKVVAISVVAKSTAWGLTLYYLCIPRGDADLVNQYWTSIATWDANLTKAYAEVTSVLLAEARGQLGDKKK